MPQREAGDDTNAGNSVVSCPRCGTGRLRKHCAPTNRCHWWLCDLPCGWATDAYRGTEVILRNERSVLDSRRGEDDGIGGDPGDG